MTGETGLEVLDGILRESAPTAALELRRVPPAPNLQERLGSEATADEFDRARALSHEDGIPFWHSVFRLGAGTPGGVRQQVLNAALYGQATEHYATVTAGSDFVARAEQLIVESPDGNYVVATSRVKHDRGERHFLMLDFSVKERWIGATQSAVGAIRALGTPGTILSSGRSFHFIGDNLATWEDYSRFLYRALLLVPLVDERWIAHQLLARTATLRVSPNSQGDVPRAITHV